MEKGGCDEVGCGSCVWAEGRGRVYIRRGKRVLGVDSCNFVCALDVIRF